MPEVFRIPLRMECKGIDLVSPIDRMPVGSFPYLFNVRILQEGRIDGRPGYQPYIQLADIPNSIRRLNRLNGHIYVGGGGTNLYSGDENTYAPVDTGYSGDPLSLIPFKPEESPESWMYVFDRLKSTKVSPFGGTRSVGIAPPTLAPDAEYAPPSFVPVSDGQSAIGWSATGVSTGPITLDRTNGSSPSITSINYLVGSTGWAVVQPSITQPFWMGSRMGITLNPGGANQEDVVIRDVLGPINNTTVAAILYDTGSDGLCTVVLTDPSPGLERNSLIEIDSEVIRVLEVNRSPMGNAYSIRCSTTLIHGTGAPVTGLYSWFVYTINTHAGGELVRSNYLQAAHPASGVGAIQLTSNINASIANGRPIDPANDYLHISLFISNPDVVTDIQVLINMDIGVNFSFDNPGNSYKWTFTGQALKNAGASANSWVEMVVPIAQATRSGSDRTRTLATISGIAVQMTATDACPYGFDWWYLFGTYGPVVLPNSPVGIVYQSRFRDSSIGSHSVPGPTTRYELFPLREGVIITPQTTTQGGVDSIDIYRQGGTITSPLYVGTVENNDATPFSYLDSLSDDVVLAANQAPDLNAFQPWPILQRPKSGEVFVVGTSVVLSSGDAFDLGLLNNSAITINGTVYQTYGQPTSFGRLELTQDAGFLASANYAIAAPTVAGQPLPFAFGPLEGPFSPVVFGLGDPLNGGLLYYTNFSDADSASDKNTLELSTPSSDLVSGAVWNGLAFAGDRDSVYCVRYTYLTDAGSNAFQWARVGSAPSGMWSRWSCCTCPVGVAYLGRDGIYITTDSATVNITDKKLYPLFPHDGVPARAVNSGSNIVLPVDMTKYNNLRLTYCDETLRFSYQDVGGNYNTLVYEIYKERWLLNNYADAISFHYLVEASAATPTDQEILMLSLNTNSVVIAADDRDSNVDITSIVLTPSLDGGDERSQKLYVDTMTQADGSGTLSMAASYNNAQAFSPVVSDICTGSIQQYLQNISSLADLSLYRNIGAKFSWTGGPGGPRLYSWEPSGFLQPYLTSFFVTQQIPLSFPGWKHIRRMFPALISTGPVTFTIKTQDGRIFGPYTINAVTGPTGFPLGTNGLYRILPQMLDQNIKDLAFSFQLDGRGRAFAFFPGDFTLEVKEWNEATFIKLAIFKA